MTSSLQIFVCDSALGCSAPLTRTLRLHIADNHGHANYTCIYNVKVFGDGVGDGIEQRNNAADTDAATDRV
jgi:hypothetical protein